MAQTHSHEVHPAATKDATREVTPIAVGSEFSARNQITPADQRTYHDIQHKQHGSEAGLNIPPAHSVLSDASSTPGKGASPQGDAPPAPSTPAQVADAAPATSSRTEDVTSQEKQGFKHVKSTDSNDQTRMVETHTAVTTSDGASGSPTGSDAPASPSPNQGDRQPTPGTQSSFDIPPSAPPTPASFDTIDARASVQPPGPPPEIQHAAQLPARNDIADTIKT